MKAQIPLQKTQQPLACSIDWKKSQQKTQLVAHWLTDKDGNLFRCWVKETVLP